MSGSIGVVNGVAMYTGDTISDGIAYINVGGLDFSDLRCQFKILTIEAADTNTNGAALRFRRSDESNWWEFGMSPTTRAYVLRKCLNGDTFTVAEPGVEPGAGDVIKVEAYAERINCFVNEVLVISITDTDLMANTNVGIRFSAGCVLTTVDNFFSLVLLQDIRPLTDQNFSPDYEFFIDWDNDGGLTLGDFENPDSLDSWSAFGTSAPTIALSDDHVKSGTNSLKIVWNNWNLFQFDTAGHGFNQGAFAGPEYANPGSPFKFDQTGQGFDDGFFAVTKNDTQPTVNEPQFAQPGVFRTIDNLIPGRQYTLRVWVYIPGTILTTGAQITIDGLDGSTSSTINNDWEKLEYTYTATATSHQPIITSSTVNPVNGDTVYVDEIMNIGAYEDVTDYVLGSRTSPAIDFKVGRDTARSLASIAPGDLTMELFNDTQIFSPDNPGSVLAGFLVPGRPVLIKATYNNQTVSIFHGFIDNYIMNPHITQQSVTISCMDFLQYLANAKVTVDMYPSIQTGEAINVILDSIDWPEEKREISYGATTMRWWWEEKTNGLDAIQKIIESEGIPAIAYVDPFGNFVFEDRHYRLRNPRSNSIQTFVRSNSEFDEPNMGGTQPTGTLSPTNTGTSYGISPMIYDIGWKDIINKIEVDVEERGMDDIAEVWSSDDLVSIAPNETFTVNVSANSPFYNAIVPDPSTGDIVLQTGSGAIDTINMTRDSGQSTTLNIKAGATAVTIRRIALRANPITVRATRQVLQSDSTSVTKYGPQNSTNEFPWAGINDMNSIAQIILGHRAERLPIVYFSINNGHPVRISNILNRRLSDRIHLQEMLQTFMDDDFIIETLEHTINDNGTSHTLTIGCEKAREQNLTQQNAVQNPTFTFDVVGQGFDDGYFLPGNQGFTFTDTLFILDQSELDVDGLGF